MHSKQQRAESRTINSGLVANLCLATLKTCFGILGHSEALLADGINSTSDTAYYVVVKVCVFFAHKPPDREHPYGHRQMESIAALTVGSFVITTAIALFWDAVNNVYDILSTGGAYIPVNLAALWVALFTVGVKLVLFVSARRVSSRSGNAAILALARDHRNDVFSASSAAIGILVSRSGCPWADPLVGGLVAGVVLCTGVQILRESAADLMDAVPGKLLEEQTRALLGGVPGLAAVEEVLAHRFGPYLVLHVTIGVDGGLTVATGDEIAAEVERRLLANLALVRRVSVHYHPSAATGGVAAAVGRSGEASQGPEARPPRG
jgi:cation diffusion facilitator family transporter